MYTVKDGDGYSVVEKIYGSPNKEDCEFYIKMHNNPKEIFGENHSIEDSENSYLIDKDKMYCDNEYLYESSNDLRELIKSHPDTPIIYLVQHNRNSDLRTEYVNEREHGYLIIPAVYVVLDKVTYYNGLFIDDEGDLEARIHDDFCDKYPDIGSNLRDEAIKQIYYRYKWTEVIKVVIKY